MILVIFFFSSRRRHTRCSRDWSSDVCSSDLLDIFFLHDPCEADGRMEDTVAYLDRQKRGGRIRYLGLAGEASECLAFARWAGGGFEVLQVRDSLENREADCLIEGGEKLQINYGYVCAGRERGP